MTFPKRFAVPVTDGISTLPALVTNGWNVDISNAVDGGSGGSYSPLAELDIGGKGLGLYLPGSGAASGLDWPTFGADSGAVRVLDRVVACAEASFGLTSAWTRFDQVGGANLFYLVGGADTHAAYIPLEVTDAASITSVSVTLAIGPAHSGGSLPTNQPTFALVSISIAGAVNVLASGGMAAGSIGAYYNSGNPQTITFAVAAAAADRTNYKYYLRIVDENGSNSAAGNKYLSASVRNSCPQMRI